MSILDRFFKKIKPPYKELPTEVLFRRSDLNEWMQLINKFDKNSFEDWSKSEIQYLISNGAVCDSESYVVPIFTLKVKGGQLRIAKGNDEWYYVSYSKFKHQRRFQVVSPASQTFEYYICDTWQAVEQLIGHLE